MRKEDNIRDLVNECIALHTDFTLAYNNRPYCSSNTNPFNCPRANKYCVKLRELASTIEMDFPFESRLLAKNILLLPVSSNGHQCMNRIIFERISIILQFLDNVCKSSKPRKIFISHSEKDKLYVSKFVVLLERMGIKEDQIFCSSIEGYNIPLNQHDDDITKVFCFRNLISLK